MHHFLKCIHHQAQYALAHETYLREGVQISGHTDADADQSGPDFFRFRFNRYRFYRYRLKWNRQRVKPLHRANYRHINS